jgi:hypothetical protein
MFYGEFERLPKFLDFCFRGSSQKPPSLLEICQMQNICKIGFFSSCARIPCQKNGPGRCLTSRPLGHYLA